jgi:hypothetical protein
MQQKTVSKQDIQSLETVFEKYAEKLHERIHSEPTGQELVTYDSTKNAVIEIFRNLAEEKQSRLVQVYKEAPKLFDPERALICNQSWAKLPSAHIVTIEQAMNPTVPTIAAMKKYTPEGMVVDLVEAIMIETILSINVKRNMTKEQIASCALDIVHHPEFYFLSISEITFIMRKGKNGDYNEEGLFNALGPNDIFAWIRKYLSQRDAHIETIRTKENLYHKTDMLKASEWDEENLEKIKEIFKSVKAKEKQTFNKRKFIPKTPEEFNKIREELQAELFLRYKDQIEQNNEWKRQCRMEIRLRSRAKRKIRNR